MSREEYKARVSKLTGAIAKWIHSSNPSQEKISAAMKKAQISINKWYSQIEKA